MTGMLRMAKSTGESDGERLVGFPACVQVFGVRGFPVGESVEDGEENKREGGRDPRDGR